MRQLQALNEQMLALNSLSAKVESGALDDLQLAAHLDSVDAAMTIFERMLHTSDGRVRVEEGLGVEGRHSRASIGSGDAVGFGERVRGVSKGIREPDARR